jgi:hypothetical protein
MGPVPKVRAPAITLITGAGDKRASALRACCLPGLPFQYFVLPQHCIAQEDGCPNGKSGGEGGSKDRANAAIGGRGQGVANLANAQWRPKVGDEGEDEGEDVQWEVAEHDMW